MKVSHTEVAFREGERYERERVLELIKVCIADAKLGVACTGRVLEGGGRWEVVTPERRRWLVAYLKGVADRIEGK